MKKFLTILFLLSGVAVGFARDIDDDDKLTAKEIASWHASINSDVERDAAIEASYAVGKD